MLHGINRLASEKIFSPVSAIREPDKKRHGFAHVHSIPHDSRESTPNTDRHMPAGNYKQQPEFHFKKSLGDSMIGIRQQLLLLKILKNGVVTKDNNGVYSSDAFYRAIMFLRKNGMLYSERQSNYNSYYLSLKGNLVARWLAGLSNAPEEYRKYGII